MYKFHVSQENYDEISSYLMSKSDGNYFKVFEFEDLKGNTLLVEIEFTIKRGVPEINVCEPWMFMNIPHDFDIKRINGGINSLGLIKKQLSQNYGMRMISIRPYKIPYKPIVYKATAIIYGQIVYGSGSDIDSLANSILKEVHDMSDFERIYLN